MVAGGVRKEGSSPPPPSEPLLSTEHKGKEKSHNTKPGGQPGQGFPWRLPALYFPASLPHHVEALQFLTRRQQEVTCGFQAGELVSESFGSKAWVKQSHLQPAARV